MCRTDFRKEGVLNEKNMLLLYERKKRVIDCLFNINTLEEFIEIFYEVFDSDNVFFVYLGRVYEPRRTNINFCCY
jgi:hypothetical protein